MKKFQALLLNVTFLMGLNAYSQVTLVLQPDSTGKDAIIDSYYPNFDNSASPEFNSAAWTHFGDIENERSLIEFDLTLIPQGAVINSATLYLYNNPTSVNGLQNGEHSQLSGSNASWLRRITDPWLESVSWNTQPATTTQSQVLLPADTNVNQNYVTDVTQLVIDMINNPSTSFGFMLQMETETYYRCLLFASGDHPDSALHPKLVIEYTACIAVPQAAFSAPMDVCQGSCIDFINQSSNATAYQWYFPGGTPDTSTAINPGQICYPLAGQYDVTLISYNGNCTDTLFIPNGITVFAPTLPQGIQQSGDTLFSDTGFVSYQWYYNGNLIPGATQYYYVASFSGNYNVICTDLNGCEVEAVIFDVIASTPALFPDEVILAAYDRTNKTLKVTGDGIKIKGVSIYNLYGAVLDVKNESASNSFCTLGFSSGIYFLRIDTDKGSFSKKIILNN